MIPSASQTLAQLEQMLRKPEGDRRYLCELLVVLAQVVGLDIEKEDGLSKAALGGMAYCMERLRTHWAKPGETAKTLEELKEIFAGVELSRYAADQDVYEDTKKRYRDEALLVRAYALRLPSPDGRVFHAFASHNKQTTIDGRVLHEGEMVDATSAQVIGFPVFLKQEQERLRK